ncbi:MAG: hypothetical protein J2P17_05605 [Mycobacterium sp.]|nr:hypothetical protein [Mycobacterium sp.]
MTGGVAAGPLTRKVDVGLIEAMLGRNRRRYGVLAGTDIAPVPWYLPERARRPRAGCQK